MRTVFRLYPQPTGDLCTPYVCVQGEPSFCRLAGVPGNARLVTIRANGDYGSVFVEGIDPDKIHGARVPDRAKVLSYLDAEGHIAAGFRQYARSTLVVPTFPLFREEAFVKTLIRQVISASQAKKLFSAFVKAFGFERSGVFGFPGRQTLSRISTRQLKHLGLGYKADMIVRGLRLFAEADGLDFAHVPGIGPWSLNVLRVEIMRDYRHYPFSDKSGDRIREMCNVDLCPLFRQDPTLAADLYVYGASFIEAGK